MPLRFAPSHFSRPGRVSAAHTRLAHPPRRRPRPTTQSSEVVKFLLSYVILKLKLIKSKCLPFVNDVERSYRLELFLEQFSIKSCVLNPGLALNSR